MKVFIVLALLSVAFATPAIQPITLPEVPQPAMEMDVELPKPIMPDIQIADIRPLLVPQEVIAELRSMGAWDEDLSDNAVHVVDVAENIMNDIPSDEESPVDAVIVVDHFEEAVVLNEVADDIVDSVHFVEVAENNEGRNMEALMRELPEVNELAASDNLEAVANAVQVVEAVQNIEEGPASADAVIVVDHAEEPLALAETDLEPVQADAVVVVNEIQFQSEDAPENEKSYAVHVVDIPLPEKVVAPAVEEYHKVRVVDLPSYPGKQYDNPLLR